MQKFYVSPSTESEIQSMDTIQDGNRYFGVHPAPRRLNLDFAAAAALRLHTHFQNTLSGSTNGDCDCADIWEIKIFISDGRMIPGNYNPLMIDTGDI